MRPRETAVLVLFCCLSASGCAVSALDMAPERPDRPWTPATTPQGEIIAGEPGVSNGTGGYVLPENPALAKGLRPRPSTRPRSIHSQT
jgi:outer membrane protein